MQKFHEYPITSGAYTKLQDLCPENSYCLLEPYNFSGIIPDSLLAKCKAGLVMASGTVTSEYAFGVINLLRYDENDLAIDQQPFGYIIHNSGVTATTGLFLDHGNWNGRTVNVSSGVADLNFEGFINAYGRHIPKVDSGSIHKLTNDSPHLAAFKELYDQLDAQAYFEP